VQDFSLMTLSGTGLKLLWHQRLGDCTDEKLANAHKFADGVPKFTSTHDIMENCPVYLAAKMKYRARGTETTRKAVRPFQGFFIDFAFAGQRSKDKNAAVDFVGYGGETCYVLIVDHLPKSCAVLQEHRKFLLCHGFEDSFFNISQKATLKMIDVSSWIKVVTSIDV
jgi:hypothetical protein